jgi:hypothetical protein
MRLPLRSHAPLSPAQQRGVRALLALLVLADLALVGAWLAGASGVARATGVVTLLMACTVVWIHEREGERARPLLLPRASQGVRLAAATAFVLVGAAVLLVIFR